jgi:hypothetical protein
MIRFSQGRTVSKEQQNHTDTDEEDDGIDLPDTPYPAKRNSQQAWTSSSSTEARQDGNGANGQVSSDLLNAFVSHADSVSSFLCTSRTIC